VLQPLGNSQSFDFSEPGSRAEPGSTLNIQHIAGILKRRFFGFLIPFGVVAVLGMLFAAMQKPNYLSEAKLLLESQGLAPDIVKPVVTANATERVQALQQRVMTRDNLLAISRKFQLFPEGPSVLDLMRESLQLKPVAIENASRTNPFTVAFTVGFEYSDPKVAMQVVNEIVGLILNEDERSRNSWATEAVRISSDEVKDIESKLEAIQRQILDAATRPPDIVPTISAQQASQLNALATLRAELIQKQATYSDAHPAVVALKKRIGAMEKTLGAPPEPAAQRQVTQVDDIESLKRQRETIEKRLSESNTKLAAARITERLNRGQQSDRLQVIEQPSMPQKPAKSNRMRIVAIAFAAALMVGAGCAFAIEFLDGSIRGIHQLSGVVPQSLVVSIPYITTREDVFRARAKITFGALCLAILVTMLGGLAAAIALHLTIDPSSIWLAIHSGNP
jgi:uncharacterized protein involved in exopolysaccharide biosynthesis